MEPLFILRICEKNSSVITRFEILLRLSGYENFGPSRNGAPEQKREKKVLVAGYQRGKVGNPVDSLNDDGVRVS